MGTNLSITDTTLNATAGTGTAGNGLTLDGNEFQLGGSLTKATTITQGNYNMLFGLSGTGDFEIQEGSNSVFFVKDDGTVGVGTNAPSAKLQISGTSDDELLLLKAYSSQSSDILSIFKSDGTTQLVGLEADGTLHFENDATTFDDVMVPGLSAKTDATAPDLIPFAPATTNLLVFGFNGSGSTPKEQVYFTVQIPHPYKAGSNLYPHVHWSPSTSAAGNVKWQLEYTWQSINGTFSAPTIISATDSTESTQWKHLIAPFTAIDGTGQGISSMLICRLFRDPADGSDTYEADAAFLQFDIHIEQDTLGSREEFNK